MTSSSHTQKTLIGTHSGQFHCDDALACFLIKQLKPYRNSEIIRTRDAEELEKCEIVVDVGFVYDHTLKRYDHHQKTFNLQLKDILPHKTFGNIKLSSAGLIYAHYGHEIIAEILMSNSSDSNIDAVFDYVYENFIKEIDAIDNGIDMFDDQEPRYRINTNLSNRVCSLNPAWNEEQSHQISYRQFLKAIEITGQEFLDIVKYCGNSWLLAREFVLSAYEKRFEIDQKGRIMILNREVPFLEHLFEIKKLRQDNNIPSFVIYFNDWRGLPVEEIEHISQIKGCIFVHNFGFIGGNKTLEGAVEMAIRSLE
uniref:UPF0160 protein C27H6.8 n=1 Tax=Sarcoptes scabiei TaxID=52283 RepID=A0A834VDP5_SARSC